MPFGYRGDPKPGAIVFQSLAYILQRFAKDANPQTQVSDHLITTLTDVPLYLKESYRANLPELHQALRRYHHEVRLPEAVHPKDDVI